MKRFLLLYFSTLSLTSCLIIQDKSYPLSSSPTSPPDKVHDLNPLAPLSPTSSPPKPTSLLAAKSGHESRKEPKNTSQSNQIPVHSEVIPRQKKARRTSEEIKELQDKLLKFSKDHPKGRSSGAKITGKNEKISGKSKNETPLTLSLTGGNKKKNTHIRALKETDSKGKTAQIPKKITLTTSVLRRSFRTKPAIDLNRNRRSPRVQSKIQRKKRGEHYYGRETSSQDDSKRRRDLLHLLDLLTKFRDDLKQQQDLTGDETYTGDDYLPLASGSNHDTSDEAWDENNFNIPFFLKVPSFREHPREQDTSVNIPLLLDLLAAQTESDDNDNGLSEGSEDGGLDHEVYPYLLGNPGKDDTNDEDRKSLLMNELPKIPVEIGDFMESRVVLHPTTSFRENRLNPSSEFLEDSLLSSMLSSNRVNPDVLDDDQEEDKEGSKGSKSRSSSSSPFNPWNRVEAGDPFYYSYKPSFMDKILFQDKPSVTRDD